MSKCLPLSSEPVLHLCVGVKCGEMKGKLQPDIREWGLPVEKQWGYFPFLKTAESCGCAAVWSSKAPVCWETGISASPTIDPLSPEHWSRKESFCSLNLGDLTARRLLCGILDNWRFYAIKHSCSSAENIYRLMSMFSQSYGSFKNTASSDEEARVQDSWWQC